MFRAGIPPARFCLYGEYDQYEEYDKYAEYDQYEEYEETRPNPTKPDCGVLHMIVLKREGVRV